MICLFITCKVTIDLSLQVSTSNGEVKQCSNINSTLKTNWKWNSCTDANTFPKWVPNWQSGDWCSCSVTPPVCVVGTKFPRRYFIPGTCCLKLSWFELVRHKQGQEHLNFQCRIASYALLLQTVPAMLQFKNKNQYLPRVHQFAQFSCNMRSVQTHEGTCPPSRMCWPLSRNFPFAGLLVLPRLWINST